eukprot:SAG11_NODE_9686_length_890_cov_0.749684_2_plen_96_part_00
MCAWSDASNIACSSRSALSIPIRQVVEACAERSESCAAIVAACKSLDRSDTEMEPVNADDTRRREAAQKRQAAILAQFAEQQQVFTFIFCFQLGA